MMEEISLSVSEVFGPTVQGEGPNAGKRTGFIRLGLCNLDCSWCDTPYTWDWTRFDRKLELSRWTVGELVDNVMRMGVPRVVISGGEPLVQSRHLAHLLRALNDVWTVEIETNGTLPPGDCADLVHQWNVSPKLAHSGVDRAKAWNAEAIFSIMEDAAPAVFKFVVQTTKDLSEVDEFSNLFHIPPHLIWIMPEGIDAPTMAIHLARVADATIERGYNLTARLHVLAWGNKRGK